MFNSYATDIIRIVEYRYDSKGVSKSIESSDIKARIEDANNLIRDYEGKEVMPNGLVMFKYDKDIEYTWKIKIKEKNGVVYEDPDREWEIKKIETLGLRKKTHKEVYF